MAEADDDLDVGYVGDASVSDNGDTPVEVYEVDAEGSASEVKPTPARKSKRESTSQLVTLLWGGAGTALVKTQVDIPVGRVLQLQAPLAGNKIDEIIANTWLDTVLQPFVAQANKLEGLGTLITLPLLVAAYERAPQEMSSVLNPLLMEVVSATLVDLAPVLKEKKRKQTTAAKTLSDINASLGLNKDDDPIVSILNSIFAPPETAEEGPDSEQP